MYVKGGGGDMVSLVFPLAIFGSQPPYYLVLFFLCPPPHSITHNCGQNTMSFSPPPTHTLLHHFVCWCIIHWHFMWKIHSHIMFMHTKCANIIIIGLKYHHFATESIIAIFNAINATYECCILGITAVPREIENNAYAKCGGKNGVFWEMCMWRKSDDRQFG